MELHQNKAKKIRITKCYLIEICDAEENELESEYYFGNYKEAKEYSKRMRDEYNEQEEN